MMIIFDIVIIFAKNNQIKKLREYHIAESYSVLKATAGCWKSISELNGYLMAVRADISNDELKLLHICEARNALEMEGSGIAYIRLFEAYASENKLKEPLAELIFEMANIARSLRQVNANMLPLNLPAIQKQKKQNDNLPGLKKEINQYLAEPISSDVLLFLGLLHGYIAMQKDEFRHPVFFANTIINHWMGEHNLLQIPILPMSLMLKSSAKQTELMLKSGFERDDMQAWILYFLNIMGNAAKTRLRQLQSYMQLKKSTREIMAKYTLYPLPTAELLEVLFEKPFIKAKDIIVKQDCHRQTAYAYLLHLVQLGVLVEKKSGREKLYFHKRLFEVLADETILSP